MRYQAAWLFIFGLAVGSAATASAEDYTEQTYMRSSDQTGSYRILITYDKQRDNTVIVDRYGTVRNTIGGDRVNDLKSAYEKGQWQVVKDPDLRFFTGDKGDPNSGPQVGNPHTADGTTIPFQKGSISAEELVAVLQGVTTRFPEFVPELASPKSTDLLKKTP